MIWSVFTLGFSDRTLQDLFGCMNFHENIGTVPLSMLRAAGCFLRAPNRSRDHTINSFTKWENASGTLTFWGKTVGKDLFLVYISACSCHLNIWRSPRIHARAQSNLNSLVQGIWIYSISHSVSSNNSYNNPGPFKTILHHETPLCSLPYSW